jgi:hypothetical protein
MGNRTREAQQKHRQRTHIDLPSSDLVVQVVLPFDAFRGDRRIGRWISGALDQKPKCLLCGAAQEPGAFISYKENVGCVCSTCSQKCMTRQEIVCRLEHRLLPHATGPELVKAVWPAMYQAEGQAHRDEWCRRAASLGIPAVAVGTDRQCGTCTACCTHMSVTELDKGMDVRCRHVCSEGCGIYESRPHVCRQWSCAWLLGADCGERPDQSKLMINLVAASRCGLTSPVDGFEYALHAIEVYCADGHPDAHRDPRFRAWLDAAGFCAYLPQLQLLLIPPSETLTVIWVEIDATGNMRTSPSLLPELISKSARKAGQSIPADEIRTMLEQIPPKAATAMIAHNDYPRE